MFHFTHWYYVIYAVILRRDILLPLLYVFSFVARIFTFSLCSCAVCVIGHVAVVTIHKY